MSDWKKPILERIRDNYKKCRDCGSLGVDKSYLVQYLLEEKQNAVAVRMKEAVSKSSMDDEGRAELWKEAVSLLRETNNLSRRECERRGFDKDRLDAWRQDGAIESVPDRSELLYACIEIVKFARTRNRCELLLEYVYDRVAGDKALAASDEAIAVSEEDIKRAIAAKKESVANEDTTNEETEIDKSSLKAGETLDCLLVRVKSGADAGTVKLLEGDRPTERQVRDAIMHLLAKEAEEWLYNVGMPISGSAPSKVRVKDVPLRLVELCLTSDRGFATSLGVESAATASLEDVKADEVDGLYRRLRGLLKDPKKKRFIVPIIYDPRSDMALYLMGPGVANDSDSDVVRKLFGVDEVDAPFFAIVYRNSDDGTARFEEADYCSVAAFEDERAQIVYDEWRGRKAEVPMATNPHDASKLKQITGERGRAVFAKVLWDSVVVAWIPRFDTDAKYAERALKRFRSFCDDDRGTDAFRYINPPLPVGSAGRFSVYFGSEAF